MGPRSRNSGGDIRIVAVWATVAMKMEDTAVGIGVRADEMRRVEHTRVDRIKLMLITTGIVECGARGNGTTAAVAIIAVVADNAADTLVVVDNVVAVAATGPMFP